MSPPGGDSVVGDGRRRPAGGATHRVVHIDAQPHYRLLVHLALVPETGFEVTGEADSVASGEALLSRERPDIVLLDPYPSADGLATLARVRDVADGALIILLSGLPVDELRWPLQAAGS